MKYICSMCLTEFEKIKNNKFCNECKPKRYKQLVNNWYVNNIEHAREKRRENTRNNTTKNYLSSKSLLRRAKVRAKEKNLEFDIEESDIVIPDVCPILKTPFIIRTPYTASLDKIDNTLGYVKGNIQVISRKANMMKSDASREELINFANWVLNNE